MEKTPEFISYKKVLVFGANGTGKTTLSKYIETGEFSDESHTEGGKKIKFIFFFVNRYHNNENFRRNGEFKVIRFKLV